MDTNYTLLKTNDINTNHTSLKDQKTLTDNEIILGFKELIVLCDEVHKHFKAGKDFKLDDFNIRVFLEDCDMPLFLFTPENLGLLNDFSLTGLSYIIALHLIQLLTGREIKLTNENMYDLACNNLTILKLYPLSSNINKILINIIMNGLKLVPNQRKYSPWIITQLNNFIKDKESCFIQYGPEPESMSERDIEIDVRVSMLETNSAKKQESDRQQERRQLGQYIGNMNNIIELKTKVLYLEESNSKLETTVSYLKESNSKLEKSNSKLEKEVNHFLGLKFKISYLEKEMKEMKEMRKKEVKEMKEMMKKIMNTHH